MCCRVPYAKCKLTLYVTGVTQASERAIANPVHVSDSESQRVEELFQDEHELVAQ